MCIKPIIKWKAINNCNYEKASRTLLETLLENRGIFNTKKFLNPTEGVLNHWSLMNNMREAVLMFHNHIKGHIHCIIDSDCDGYTSFGVLGNAIREYQSMGMEAKFTYHTHDKKIHGIFMDELKKLPYFNDISLIIVPDGGSFDYKEHKALHDLGKDVLVLDHHSPEEDDELLGTTALVVNPQLDSFPNKNLSGAGVVFKFINALDEFYNTNISPMLLDYVAVGNVGDMMDMRELETRYLVLKGMELLSKDRERRLNGQAIVGSPLLQEMLRSNEKEGQPLKEVTFATLGWDICPVLNGVSRMGKPQDKEDLFKSIMQLNETREYQPRRKKKTDPKPPVEHRPLVVEAVRQAKNAKSRQDNLKKKITEKLEEDMTKDYINNNKVLFVIMDEKKGDPSLAGLVANNFANKYRKPCVMLVNDKKGWFKGSGRDYRMSPIENFNKLLFSTGLFEKVAGHPSAFGVKLEANKLEEVKKSIAEQLSNVVMEDVYLIDYEIPVGRLTSNDVTNVGQYHYLWSSGVEKPKFAITDIYIDTKDIELIGSRNNVIKFVKNGITFIKFFTNAEEHDRMRMKDRNSFGGSVPKVKLDVIGEFEINEYDGKFYPQINIVDYNVEKDKEELPF